MRRPAPEDVERFRRALPDVAPNGLLGVAVSGGADSLALLLLAAAAFPGTVSAATVDHQLRPEAADEARFVASVCAELGVPHTTLVPEQPIRGSLQASARAARYSLLSEWCRRNGLALLATGHQLDDQAETLMMRLLRGSGVAGLSGVRPSSPLGPDTMLVRPLLGWRRSELAALVAGCGLVPVDDPSNADPRFDRVRMRTWLANASWIDPVSLATSAAALADADAALAWATEHVWERHVRHVPGGFVLAPQQLPRELVRRLVLRILTLLVPDAAPRGEALEAMLADAARGRSRTLAGVKCTGGAQWTFILAPPRRGN